MAKAKVMLSDTPTKRPGANRMYPNVSVSLGDITNRLKRTAGSYGTRNYCDHNTKQEGRRHHSMESMTRVSGFQAFCRKRRPLDKEFQTYEAQQPYAGFQGQTEFQGQTGSQGQTVYEAQQPYQACLSSQLFPLSLTPTTAFQGVDDVDMMGALPRSGQTLLPLSMATRQ
ncbi:hypothetical protein V2G26_000371 [Clonostachys chloroleuca]